MLRIFTRRLSWDRLLCACGVATIWLLTQGSSAEELTLDDARKLVGSLGQIDDIGADPAVIVKGKGPVDVRRIQFVDQVMRRVFISKRRVAAVRQIREDYVRIDIRQPVRRSGYKLGSVGRPLKIGPWDRYGRRIFKMKANVKGGSIDVVQGITQVTPEWTKVQSLKQKQVRNTETGKRLIEWTTYVATSSIPRPTLSAVLHRAIDPKVVGDRMQIVLLYLQAERFDDAQAELQAVIKDFPKLRKLKTQVVALRQQSANRLLSEIKLRQSAGQHKLAKAMFEGFPTDEVAGEVLIKIREGKKEYAAIEQRGLTLLTNLDKDLAAAASDSEQLKQVVAQIKAELNINNIDRLTSYRLVSQPGAAPMAPKKKLAMAVSGWVVGSDKAIASLPVAMSLVKTRNLVTSYLQTDRRNEQGEILEALDSEEGATPRYVDQILKRIKPPLSAGEPSEKGFYRLAVTTPGEPVIDYLVQLPWEYDPYRRYPVVISMHGAATTPEQQIAWWAGPLGKNGRRLGQATRRGYIVIAPAWADVGQTAYTGSAREHATVLKSLRHASRRFSINTNRVFLSGHSMGGDAAWDIGLSHPDLWAGVIPIVAESKGMNAHYWENARTVPLYFVAGELDGLKMQKNSRELNRYLRLGMDATVVEYVGRGHEHFYDDVQNIFDWMGRKKRNFFPREFSCVSRRVWDNYFYWVELAGIPVGLRAAPKTTGKIGITKDRITVRTPAKKAVIWLTPELIDFDKRITIKVNGVRIAAPSPDLRTMLEDARTRGDRQHVFWARVGT
jgi:predicted esterase